MVADKANQGEKLILRIEKLAHDALPGEEIAETIYHHSTATEGGCQGRARSKKHEEKLEVIIWSMTAVKIDGSLRASSQTGVATP